MFYLTFNKKKTLIILLVVNTVLILIMAFATVNALNEKMDSKALRGKYLESLGYSIDNSFDEEIK